MHLSVCRSVSLSVCVCPESVLWQNGLLDPDVNLDKKKWRGRDQGKRRARAYNGGLGASSSQDFRTAY